MKKIILIATFILVPLILVGTLVLLQKNENIPENIENQQENEEVVVEEMVMAEEQEEEQESPEGDFKITEEDSKKGKIVKEFNDSEFVDKGNILNVKNWNTFNNEEYGFSFKYPKGWEIDINNVLGNEKACLKILYKITIIDPFESISYNFILTSKDYKSFVKGIKDTMSFPNDQNSPDIFDIKDVLIGNNLFNTFIYHTRIEDLGDGRFYSYRNDKLDFEIFISNFKDEEIKEMSHQVFHLILSGLEFFEPYDRVNESLLESLECLPFDPYIMEKKEETEKIEGIGEVINCKLIGDEDSGYKYSCPGGLGVILMSPFTEMGPSCDDGKICTTNDQMINGVCTGLKKNCPFGQYCYEGECVNN